ncbi:hypothetical protein DPEC_G00048870 [Dallia pectoralis]|uniref:Uncharacterized protein n=1 Tax=Dallia pectoralis TaxID=75939 RepID=A0ACC2HBA8_DALPE|nr:hypothetical protein DPEC_G00048870 [Dallia pectoralis]
MDACARIQGVPLRTRASIRKETVRDCGPQCLKTLLKNRKELCDIGLEQQNRDAPRLTEINFVYLPGQGDDLTLQALSSLSGELAELLRSPHVTSLRNEEVLLLKDSRRLTDRRESATQQQCWLKAVCVLRHSSGPSQAIVGMLVGLLRRYAAGIRYALELQALHRGTAEPCQPEDDDTNQSVSSIEDDFVTALEHLEEEDNSDGSSHLHGNQRDVASQTVPVHKRDKDISGSRIIISSAQRKSSINRRSPPEVSVTVQRPRGAESQWTLCSPRARLPSPTRPISESESSDGSSPSPIIFLDEVGYQKSLKAILDIPQIPGGPRDRVEDSDSEVSEFFDSFDQFDDLDELSSESCTLTLPLDQTSSIVTSGVNEKKHSEVVSGKSGSKKVSRSSSTMNPHRFDQRTLPANVKKPTPLRSLLLPRSPYGSPDSPRPARNSCEESGGPLFSPVSSSAFSPLGDGGAMDYFWKTEGDGDELELRKPQDLCSLYKTYSDFASSLSKEILGSVCGYQSPVDINDNKNLSCVCHKEFQNQSGYVMKLSEIQETVTVSKMQQRPQSLKDGIQRFATDLVEMSLGSAFRDLQKGVSSCTTTLCHLAARLTSSVFQMAFQEIGMRRAYVLKERAINGLAGFLVGEAVSDALKDFLKVKKQMFNSTVTQFAADLAEELVFEGMMEVCQFSHPSTPITPSDWSFGIGEEEDEEVVSSYASDLSESVIQEAFIELSQADVAFTTQAAISVSLDNICYVSADHTHTTCSTAAGNQAFHVYPAEQSSDPSGDQGCTVKKALFCVSGMASCVPVPQAGQAISHQHNSEEICQCKSSLANTSQTSPKRSCSSESRVVTTASLETSAATQTDLLTKTTFQNFSGSMVDMIVSEACEITSTRMKKLEDYADILSKTLVGTRPPSGLEGFVTDQISLSSLHSPYQTLGSEAGGRTSCAVSETRPMMMDTLEVPAFEIGGREGRKLATAEELVSSPGCKSNGTPGTPPSTPQQPSVVSQVKQIRQFSKKLKGKLAKEFSPATPPPTPHCLPEPELKDSPSETDKADFMLKLMRSLSEEADGNEEEEVEEEGGVEGNIKADTGHRMLSELSVGGHKLTDQGALKYAERLACHIVSLATEMDTLGVDDGGRGVEERGDSVAQFSEQTLNTLWIYAGEVAGEVISDVKKMMRSGQCRHRVVKQRSQEGAGECPHHQPPLPSEHSRNCRVAHLTEQWSGDTLHSSTSSSGMSSEYPSCESVTDEYAGYLIRVLKKEGGSRELVLDQYASRLAYRSIKLGLAHAARNVRKRSSSSRHHSSGRHHNYGFRGPNYELSMPRDEAAGVGTPCGDSDDGSQREYTELVDFAESLAYNITCDVTRKLCVSSVRLPKSLTDSCLYQKSKLEDMAENLIRNSFSCPLVSREGRSRRYHSTDSLYHGDQRNGVMQVIEHYARKIVEDTLNIGLASAGHSAQQAPDQLAPSGRLSEGEAMGSVQGETACRYCQVRECPFCMQASRPHFFGAGRRTSRAEAEVGACGLAIPEIHIDLDRRAMFADQMVTTALEGARRELSNTSLNADSGIGHDGPSFAESLTAEVMVSTLSNACQTASLSSPGREVSESTVSHQLSLSVGDDSLGSWSNLSFEDEHPDETSSLLHLSDSNGNSSSWSSLGLEGEVYEEHLSFSPSDSDGTEDKDSETKDESCVRVDRAQSQAHRLLLVINTELREATDDPDHMTYDPQLRSMLQWVAASMADLTVVQLGPSGSQELQQLPAVVQRLKEREWRVGDLLQALLRYCEETHGPPQAEPREETSQLGTAPQTTPLFQWLLEHV